MTDLKQSESLQNATSKQTLVYVSNADEPSISCYKIDTETQSLIYIGSVPTAYNVMPLAISADKQYLYAAIRSEPFVVECYVIQAKDGKLTKLTSSPLPSSMAYITTDKQGKFLLGASFHDNMISVSAIDNNGIVSNTLATYKTGPHAHSVVIHPNNRFVYVGNIGADKVLQYRLDNATGQLTPIATGYVNTEAGAGPRHIAITPSGKYLYVVTEMHASIFCYAINPESGALSFIDVTSFPAEKYGLVKSKLRDLVTAEEVNSVLWAADIKITPNGQFLYITERTSHTLSSYSIDIDTGKLTYIETCAIEKQPRAIAIDPTGQYLVTTGQQDNKIGLYAISQQTGKVTRISEAPAAKNANWVEIINL